MRTHHNVTRRLACALLALPLLVACDNAGTTRRALRDPVGEPTPVPAPQPTHITYRVTGTIPGVVITYASSSEGTTVITSDLPWFLSFDATTPTTFVYLSAASPETQMAEGDLVVQVFVNGELFRESRARGFSLVVTASGEVTQ